MKAKAEWLMGFTTEGLTSVVAFAAVKGVCAP